MADSLIRNYLGGALDVLVVHSPIAEEMLLPSSKSAAKSIVC